MNFLSHFKLRHQPFSITPDPDFVYQSPMHQAAGAVFDSGIAELAQLSVVTGGVGVGKTVLIRQFIDTAPDNLVVGLISNFASGGGDLLTWVLNAYAYIPFETDQNRLDGFRRFLKTQRKRGRRCVLIIDDAEKIANSDLVLLRKLIELNADPDVALITFLVGQPELSNRLQQSANTFLADRVEFQAVLRPMPLEETQQYINYRLKIAGAPTQVFDPAAIELVHDVAQGIPRVINIVCNLAMYYALGEGLVEIDRSTMMRYLVNADEIGHLAHLPSIAHLRTKIRTSKPRPTLMSVDPAPSKPQPERRQETVETPVRSNQALACILKEAAALKPDFDKMVLPNETAEKFKSEQTAEIIPISFQSAAPVSVPKQPQASTPKRPLMSTLSAAAVVAAAVYTIVIDRPVAEFIWPLASQQTALQHPSQGSASTVPPPIQSYLANPDGDALINEGLTLGMTDPKAAALAYARAALRGEAMAAYYLGQMYETGDGVPLNPALARVWYAFGDNPTRGARKRLDQMMPVATGAILVAPEPLLGGALEGSAAAEFVWSSASDGSDLRYAVEVTSHPDAPAQRLIETGATAAMVDDFAQSDQTGLWRVIAFDQDSGKSVASDWRSMGMAEPAVSRQ